jgi:hypothetical protein
MLAWQDAEVITVQVDPFGSDTWRLDQIVDLIKNGGVGVIPTDTVYVIAIPSCACILFLSQQLTWFNMENEMA